MTKTLSILPAALCFTAFTANAATLTLGSRVLVSENNANFNISVFPGTASYDDAGVGGIEPGTSTFTNTFGNGTVLDYNFFHSTAEVIISYASSGAGLISDVTAAPENLDGGGEDWSNVWTTTDPAGFTSTKDFNNGTGLLANTFARCADATGSINISGLTEGQIYVPHGTFINQWTLTMTMSGPGQTDIVVFDQDTANGPSRNFGWITDFTFDNTGGLYDTITYSYTNADTDGSRARFMGVVLAEPVPEPATFALFGLSALGLLLRRRH